jgi:hypothetical protein
VSGEPVVTAFVVAGLISAPVAFAIYVDREANVFAMEVEDVGTGWMLAAKAQTFKSSSSQLLPKQHLGQAQLGAQLACPSDGARA